MQPKQDKRHAFLDHVSMTLHSVFSRPRLKMRVERHRGWDLLISKDDRSYVLTIGTDDLSASIVVVSTSPETRFLYQNKFELEKIPNLRKIGITIANKIIHHPIYEVHHD